ncbi:hypothetical protein I7I53_03631 [Histoplasma capsulatum var. duboisii H88]|uniref:Uncharacterized protein n=1 Tax=Ajellomyces capsulatus (strain H88) TaxID=544711 RepID=A0A8A1LQQ1_AJEC8|nr:hypothetical protein I7I53_03631 [Histoplasma capsulatum var. duboisii H88]
MVLTSNARPWSGCYYLLPPTIPSGSITIELLLIRVTGAGGHEQIGPENLFSSRFVLYITSGNPLSTVFSIVHTLTT